MMPPNMPQIPPQAMPPPRPPDPEKMALINLPTWEEVIGLLKDGGSRIYRIDIETDSTIAASLESDIQGLDQVVTGAAKFMAEMMPAVQSGVMPMEAVKQIMMTMVRRSRMGLSVEEALDKMQPPKPQGPPPEIQIAQMKAQAEQQQAQFQAAMDERAKQTDMALEQQRMAMEERMDAQRQEREMQVETHRQEMQAQEVAHQNQLEAQRDALKSQQDAALEQMRIAADERMSAQDTKLELLIAQMNNATKIEVAEIGKQGGILQAEMANAAREASDDKLVD